MAGLNLPVPALPGIPRPYRGRGNRGKSPALPQRDKTGIAGKNEGEHLAALEREAASLKRQLLTLTRLAGAALARLEPEERAACLREAQEGRP